MENEIQYLTINLKTLDECLSYVRRSAKAGWTILEVKFEYNIDYDVYEVHFKGYIS